MSIIILSRIVLLLTVPLVQLVVLVANVINKAIAVLLHGQLGLGLHVPRSHVLLGQLVNQTVCVPVLVIRMLHLNGFPTTVPMAHVLLLLVVLVQMVLLIANVLLVKILCGLVIIILGAIAMTFHVVLLQLVLLIVNVVLVILALPLV